MDNKQPQGRFFILLVSLLLLLLLEPFFESFGMGETLINLFVTAVLLSALYSLSEDKRRLKITLPLWGLGVSGLWLGDWFQGVRFFEASSILVSFFFIYATVKILAYIIKAKRVTPNIIYGALCAYLLIGLIWAVFYIALEKIQPGSLLIQTGQELSSSCVYYSYVTLTTLGYGDMTPLTAPARSLSFVEALTGQLYLAVLVARLVGMYIAQPKES